MPEGNGKLAKPRSPAEAMQDRTLNVREPNVVMLKENPVQSDPMAHRHIAIPRNGPRMLPLIVHVSVILREDEPPTLLDDIFMPNRLVDNQEGRVQATLFVELPENAIRDRLQIAADCILIHRAFSGAHKRLCVPHVRRGPCDQNQRHSHRSLIRKRRKTRSRLSSAA